MTNGEIAAIFRKIADILALKGENPFRVNAYQRAAVTLASLPQSLSSIYAERGLEGFTAIAGIGKDLAAKIEELVQTGRLRSFEKLLASIPAGLLDIAEIPGVGPKKTAFVWKKFKVTTVAALKELAESGKLTRVKGWGEKSVANVLHGIEVRASALQRGTIAAVLPLAEEIVAALRKTKLCARVEIAGSLRRRCETIGDIDILATSSKSANVMDVFTGLPGVQDVIAKGPTKSSVRLKAGITCDLRVVEPDVFGAALYYFTGSKAHNVRLRLIAVRRGITISEYGVYRGTAEKKGRRIAAATEEDVFRSLDLPYIPPELREDHGEIEAAQSGKLPTLIEEKDLQGDLHVHSTFSDGAASMVEMAKAAHARGLKYVAITDHASPMGMVRGIKKENIREYLKRIEEARRAVPGVRILAGAEVDILADGSLYLSDAILAQLDWVVASVHSHFRQTRSETTKRLLRALENSFVRVLGHPTGRLLGKRPAIEFDEEAVFKAAVANGVALELNASPWRLDLSDVHCQTAKARGALIAIGSDAHHPGELSCRFGIGQARRGWLEKKDVINTKTWRKFEKWLKGK